MFRITLVSFLLPEYMTRNSNFRNKNSVENINTCLHSIRDAYIRQLVRLFYASENWCEIQADRT